MALQSGSGRRIAILTYGTRGDVQPMVALGLGLRQAGHSVRVVGPRAYAPLAGARGLEFEPIEGRPELLAAALADHAGPNLLRMFVQTGRHVFPIARQAFRAAQRAAQEADLIVHSFLMADAGHTLARRHGVPDISALFFPFFLPTSAFPAVGFPDLRLGAPYRLASHRLTAAAFRLGSRFLYRRLRASDPELPELAPWPFAGAGEGATPLLLAFSQHILPRPADWPSRAHVTGYWQLPPSADWRAGRELDEFLKAGAPPVYFTPGSVDSKGMGDLLRSVVRSVRAIHRRLVLGVPPGLLETEMAGPDVFVGEGIPHAWLFPQTSFVLHHGGAGTTGAAAAAGIPNTAIPFSADQAFWARRIHRLGMGPPAPPARRLTDGKLTDLLEEVFSNDRYRERAQQIGEKIRAEGGIPSAVRLINRALNGGEE